ncbi:hypothetical protein D9613_012745 [Agrocybe pediades]|uniref:Uncharacterized protein n=1 Tax=Agrocybe pediades TaxID=84607 RepID=A0A8H4VIT1_9AGAR|nr:hypothetical protein D9613_012745 [Agrocybe pediades]
MRIPTVQSRRAWAAARNLNPATVNAWWYRRRAIAKKFRMVIPKEEYELEVGNPPFIPTEIPESWTPASSPYPGTSPTLEDLSSGPTICYPSSPRRCLCSDTHNFILGLDNEDQKGAYSHFPVSSYAISFYLVVFRDATCIYAPLFLHASSRDAASASLCDRCGLESYSRPESPHFEPLSLPDAAIVSAWPDPNEQLLSELRPLSSVDPDLFPRLTGDYYPSLFTASPAFESLMPSASCCADTHVIAISWPDSLPDFEEKASSPTNTRFSDGRAWNEGLLKLNVVAPWCIGGYRFSVDGSLLGVCSWCVDLSVQQKGEEAVEAIRESK